MKKIAVVFGGQSTEHDVSIVSGLSVSKNINKEKYDVTNLYIDKDGVWFKYNGNKFELSVGEQIDNIEIIDNLMNYLKTFDCIFPVLHGLYGEDGTIQGLFELLKIPYVGCKVLASSIAMDKVYSKIIFDKAGINQTKSQYIRSYKDKFIYLDKNLTETEYSLEEISNRISKEISFPMFIKPSNFGSSVGITKANNLEELLESIKVAAKYDKKILVEEGIDGRELEVAVLGNEEVIASCVGEIIVEDKFYDYDSKYMNNTSKTTTHAQIPSDIETTIRTTAIKAFKSIDGKGLSRVDFFLDKENNIYLNEINTLPGFTAISMYPKLFEEVGINNEELTTKLIELALE